MCIHILKRTIFWAAAFILLAACNQLDTVLPSRGSYQVNALVNHSSLDECSVIAAGDTVLPYFSNSVAGDPDLANLVVYLEDAGGKQVGKRVRYTIESLPSPVKEDPVETESPPETTETESGGGETGTTTEERTGIIDDPSLTDDLVIPVDNFTGQLPPFPVVKDLEIGSYTLVFEIRGKQDLLSSVRRQILYTGSREFAAGGIRYYLPGLYGNRHLVPQGLNVMLETQVDYGEDLEPYVIWYNGNRRIGGGYVSGGMARLLWKAPQQTGFHTIRVELFPFEPQTATRGMERLLSLPVSSVTKENAAPGGDLLYHYGLAGDLLEAGAGPELARTNPEGSGPRWYPAEQIYGLALEDGDRYEASPKTLDLSAIAGDKDGLLRFFIRFLPLNEGTIFGARLDYGARPAGLRLFLAEKALYLELETGDERSLGEALELGGVENSFLGVVIDLEIRKTGIRASLKAADSPLPAPDLLVPPEAGETATPGNLATAGNLTTTGNLAIDREGERAEFPSEMPELDISPQGELRSWLGKAGARDTENRRGVPENPAADSASSPVPVAVVDDFSALVQLFDRPVEALPETPDRQAEDQPSASMPAVIPPPWRLLGKQCFSSLKNSSKQDVPASRRVRNLPGVNCYVWPF
jgi:hypothetical protein